MDPGLRIIHLPVVYLFEGVFLGDGVKNSASPGFACLGADRNPLYVIGLSTVVSEFTAEVVLHLVSPVGL